MKKVLIITYYWPPASGPGVQRWLKFAKYLPQFGWQPIILTVKDGSFIMTDPTLNEDVPSNMPVFRVSSLEPFRIYNLLRGKKGKAVKIAMESVKSPTTFFQKFSNYVRANFFIPDARLGWRFKAIPAAKKIIKEHQIETIITTGPPHSTHLIGLHLHQKNKNLKWIADLRDPWTNVFYNNFLLRSEKTKKKDKQYEDSVVKTANGVLVVSKGMQEEFQDRNKKTFLFYNGYDEKDIPKVTSHLTTKFTLSYIGNMKPNQNTIALWETLAELKKEIKDFGKFFILSFTGNVAVQVSKKIQECGIEDIVEYHPFVKHAQAVQLMTESNLLFLPIPMTKNNQYIITGKIFEYLASTTPILAIGPVDGNAATILTECNREPMIDYQDTKTLKYFLQKHFYDWQKNNHISTKIQDETHTKFSREKITKELAHLLNSYNT